jgi:hypothetical protein
MELYTHCGIVQISICERLTVLQIVILVCSMTKQLSTVEEVISELGGFDAVKDLTHRTSSSAVPVWKFRQKFPPNTFAVMMEALEAKGATAPETLWGMTQREDVAE